MKLVQIAGLVAMGFALSACATIIKGTTQSVSITTPPVEGAHCTLINSEGTWYLTSPGSVVVHKTKNDLQVTCTKDGYQDAVTVIPSKFNGVTFGNVIAGGLVGITVDAASGANYEYQTNSIIPMTLVGPPAAAVPSAAPASSGGSPTS